MIHRHLFNCVVVACFSKGVRSKLVIFDLTGVYVVVGKSIFSVFFPGGSERCLTRRGHDLLPEPNSKMRRNKKIKIKR